MTYADMILDLLDRRFGAALTVQEIRAQLAELGAEPSDISGTLRDLLSAGRVTRVADTPVPPAFRKRGSRPTGWGYVLSERSTTLEHAEARALAAEQDARPLAGGWQWSPTAAQADDDPRRPESRHQPNAAGARTSITLDHLQHEMDALREHLTHATSIRPSVQRGAELAAALRTIRPVIDQYAPLAGDMLDEAASALEEFAA